MDPRRWEEIEVAFSELVELDAVERSSRLAALGATDPALRAVVESLLAADAEADARLAPLEASLLSPAPAFAAASREPSPDPLGLAGRTVSHFRVLEPLGAGGMGVVYRAEDTHLGRPVALKFLLPQYSLDSSAKERFLHEAHSAAALDHPNLCTIYEVGESDDGRLFLAMSLYPGETLKAHLAREGPLPVGEALEITKQIAQGLACAHAAGIVHRDLKPGNVMLAPSGSVKILDFGLAKARDQSLSTSGTRFGTVSYMAPEQVRGEAVDARADLWALGVVLYEMLTGRKPFGGEHEVTIAHAIIHDEPERPTALRADVPAGVEEIILTLLEKEAAKRYATAAQLLDAVTANAAIDAPVRPLWRRLLLGGQRRLRLRTAALGVALALAVGWWGVSELGTGAPAIQSLVVLPLENLTGDAEQEYFVEGMHEALTHELSRIGALKVISRTSAMLYKGGRKPAPQIARELGVDGLIEGSVAREGDQVRITVQVIHGPSDKYLWGDSYRRELRGILALQREVAMEIARQVRVRLTSVEERHLAEARAVHPQAYDLYLRGRHFKHQEEDTGWVQARAAFERSVAIDSSFAPAWAGLAMMYALEAYGSPPHPAARARAAVEKALALDPNLSDAYVSLALVRQLMAWDWKGAGDAFRRALERNPSNWEAHYEQGWLLIRLGRLDEALAAMQRALALDPLSTVARHGVAWVHLYARRHEQAIETLRKGLELHPTSTVLQADYAAALGLSGLKEESERAEKRYLAMCCETSDAEYERLPRVRFRRYLASGETGKALELLRDVERADGASVGLAGRYVLLGDKDQALRMLEQTAETRRGFINLIKVEPGLDALRSEPRFQALLTKVGLADVTRNSGDAAAVAGRTAIAVLPFQNLSAERRHAYFAAGLHDEILTQLTKVAALKVISRTSVVGYASPNQPPHQQIASELGVRSIVEGSVQVVRDRLRVNVRLIDAATGAYLWAERYDRMIDDAFAIQSDIARQIVGAVGAVLSGAEREALAAAPTGRAEAYLLYLQGREYYIRPGHLRQNLEIAQQLYERALALDPDFALARAALSEVHGWMYWARFDHSPARAGRQREEAEAAFRLRPDLPQAHVAMGLAHYWGHLDYRQALDEFAVALKGRPNDAEVWSWIAALQRRLGNWDEVFAAFEKATQLNPRNASLFVDLGAFTYQWTRRYAEAVDAYDRALSLTPDMHWAAIRRAWMYVLWQGQLDTLRAVLSRMPRDADLGGSGIRAHWHAWLLLLERRPDSLLQVLRISRLHVFEQQASFLPTSLYTAWAHQLRGDRAGARAAFDSAQVLLDSVVRQLPHDERVHAARGLAVAGLGRRVEALREARWLEQSPLYRKKDAYGGPWVGEERARVLAQAGEAEAALDEIERVLAGPAWLTVHTLRLDPVWDPIREHPRFKALLAKYGD